MFSFFTFHPDHFHYAQMVGFAMLTFHFTLFTSLILHSPFSILHSIPSFPSLFLFSSLSLLPLFPFINIVPDTITVATRKKGNYKEILTGVLLISQNASFGVEPQATLINCVICKIGSSYPSIAL